MRRARPGCPPPDGPAAATTIRPRPRAAPPPRLPWAGTTPGCPTPPARPVQGAGPVCPHPGCSDSAPGAPLPAPAPPAPPTARCPAAATRIPAGRRARWQAGFQKAAINIVAFFIFLLDGAKN